MTRPFLTARWSNLIIVSYAVDPAMLRPHLPAGGLLELDTRDDAPERAFVSLVAFDFLGTRVRGLSLPGLRNFPEMNLRFYVRRRDDPSARGVIFIREFVPSRVIAAVARAVYNEPYVRARMSSSVSRAVGASGDELFVEHRLAYAGAEHSLGLRAGPTPYTPGPDSREHWFKEHRWGFGRARRGGAIVYEVEHPMWECYPVRGVNVRVRWGALYGPEWAVLQDGAPWSAVLAKGSPVAVYPKRGLGAGRGGGS